MVIKKKTPIFTKYQPGGSMNLAKSVGGMFSKDAGGAGGGITSLLGGAGGGGEGGPSFAGKGLGGMAAGAGKALGQMIGGGGDPIAGAKEAGLDEYEMNAVNGAGSGAGVASGILGTVGDIASNIPGPWGAIIGGGLNLIGGIVGGEQKKKQQIEVNQLVAANTEKDSDISKQDKLMMLGAEDPTAPDAPVAKGGGLIYKKPSVLEFMTPRPQTFRAGGKWDHPFKIVFPESTMERKKQPVKIFKRGGKFNDPDKTNVIVTGARHHENNNLGDKGVPVIDKAGEKVFEVEGGELILAKESSVALEEILKKYKEVEIYEDKAGEVLKSLGKFFKDEVKNNLHNYAEAGENAI